MALVNNRSARLSSELQRSNQERIGATGFVGCEFRRWRPLQRMATSTFRDGDKAGAGCVRAPLAPPSRRFSFGHAAAVPKAVARALGFPLSVGDRPMSGVSGLASCRRGASSTMRGLHGARRRRLSPSRGARSSLPALQSPTVSAGLRHTSPSPVGALRADVAERAHEDNRPSLKHNKPQPLQPFSTA